MKSTLTLIIASLLAPLASAAQWDYPATSDKVLNEAQALSVSYFPQQSQNEDYSGHTWTSAVSYMNYSLLMANGSHSYRFISHLGLAKGEVSVIEIYDQNKEADSGSSLLLPVRMVANPVENQE